MKNNINDYDDFVIVLLNKGNREILEKEALKNDMPLFKYCHNLLMKGLKGKKENKQDDSEPKFTIEELDKAIKKTLTHFKQGNK